ncbi:MAG: UDP-3-O-(3-hydroxymyristoyl)glucosamine N-acyltransferase [Planctomycetota bacterium]|jgi:UDP-3-O-[3-hydroxymyristoyl] glucosamine N-acyltransferase
MQPKTLDELAELCGASVEGDGSRLVRGPASLTEAGDDEVTFFGDARYEEHLRTTRAAGVLLGEGHVVEREDAPTLLRCADPGRAFTKVVEAFSEPPPSRPAGIHPTAVVDPTAAVDPSASIGPGVVIEGQVEIGARTVLRAQVFVGHGSTVGADSVLEPGVVLGTRSEVGQRCILHAGAVLGSDGFGFEPTAEGWVKIPQCGRVVVEDDVEIGANVSIDRARFGATRIGRGAKLDNLVHVAHNVQVGPGALLIAQVGVAGSAEIGSGAIVAGQAGVAGHTRVGPGVRIGGQAGVYGDILEPGDYVGTPARPRTEFLRSKGAAKRVERLAERVRELERRLDGGDDR